MCDEFFFVMILSIKIIRSNNVSILLLLSFTAPETVVQNPSDSTRLTGTFHPVLPNPPVHFPIYSRRAFPHNPPGPGLHPVWEPTRASVTDSR